MMLHLTVVSEALADTVILPANPIHTYVPRWKLANTSTLP